MKFIFILLAVLLVAAVTGAILTKKGILKDTDSDGIPDVVEDVVDDVKEKYDDIKEEVKDLPKKLTRKKPGRSKKETAKGTTTGGGPSNSLQTSANGDHYRKNRKAQQ